MPGRPGQALTAKEIEEIERYNQLGLQRPNKYHDVVFDSSRTGGAGYRWKTNEERRAGDEEARRLTRAGDEVEKALRQTMDAAQGRATSEEAATGEGEGSPFLTDSDFRMTESLVEGGPAAIPGAPSFGAAPRPEPKPMPAAVATAMRKVAQPSTGEKRAAGAPPAAEDQG